MSAERPLPKFVGRYEIVRLLGSGGMGDVYLARDPNIDRLLAVKTVRMVDLGLRDSAERKARLLREARAAGKLMHTHVVTLFDAGEADGLLYLAFELVEGQDLSQRLKSGTPLSLGDTLRLGRQVASALEYAHAAGIVHRDIKPSNILIGRGGVAKVADFGIAKLMDQSTDLTRTGSVVGSPQYMSPEQIRGETLDGRSDIFSLGVVLYELLTSTRPFDGESLSTLVFQILSQMPEPVDALRPGLPPPLVALVERMMTKERDQRQASATELVAEITRLERELPGAVMAQLVYLPPGETRETSVLSSEVATGVARRQPEQAAARVVPLPPSPPGSSPPPPPLPEPEHPTGGLGSSTELRPSAAGTAGATQGRRLPWGLLGGGLLVLLVLAAGVLWWVQRGRAENGAAVATPALAEAGIGGAKVPVERPAADFEVTSSTGERGGEPDAAVTALLADRPQPPAEATDSPLDPAPAHPAPRGTPPPPPPPTLASTGEETSAAVVTPPRQTSPRAAAGTTSPPPQAAQSVSNQELAEATFDRRASHVAQRLQSGLFLRLQVIPPEALVTLLRRGEARAIVKGRAHEFDPRKKRSRSLELPFAGQYLLVLRHDGLPDHSVLIDAAPANGQTPGVVSARLGGVGASLGPRGVVKARSLAFTGFPTGTVVFVDGRRVGEAARWPGGGIRPNHPNNLQLEPGPHEIRVEIPGRSPLVRRVVGRRTGRHLIRYSGS